jgi:hypothetical protein
VNHCQLEAYKHKSPWKVPLKQEIIHVYLFNISLKG